MMSNFKTERLSYLRLEQCAIEFKSAVKRRRCLFPVLPVVLSKPTIEDNQRRIFSCWKALQKPLVLPKIQIAVRRRTGHLYHGIKLPPTLALCHRLLQHPGKPISVAHLPVGLREIWLCLKRLPQQRHGL